MDKLQECARIGRKIALWCALPAALVLLGIVVSKFVDVFLEPQERQNLDTGLLYWGILLPVLLIALYLPVAFLGHMAGRLIYHKMLGVAGSAFIGICLALSCLLSVVMMWIIYNVIYAAVTDSTILGAVLMFTSIAGLAILLFGSVPAIFLGVLYGILVRKRCGLD